MKLDGTKANISLQAKVAAAKPWKSFFNSSDYAAINIDKLWARQLMPRSARLKKQYSQQPQGSDSIGVRRFIVTPH